MTLKNIIKMATNSDIIYYMKKIQFEDENMCHSTKYEAASRQAEIKRYAREIKNILESKKTSS